MNQTGSRLAQACANSEVAIVMTDWVSHSVESIVRKTAVNMERCAGQMAQLRQRRCAQRHRGDLHARCPSSSILTGRRAEARTH
jgi:hypothetical protein